MAVFLGVKQAGAAYLVHLGVQAFRHRKELRAADMAAPVSAERRGDLRTVLGGAFVGVTNPKGLVFFAAVLPQFVDHAAGRVPVQMMVLGLVPVAIGLVTDTLWGLGASAARAWFARSDRRLSLIGGAGGFAMIGLGVTVAATGRSDGGDSEVTARQAPHSPGPVVTRARSSCSRWVALRPVRCPGGVAVPRGRPTRPGRARRLRRGRCRPGR